MRKINCCLPPALRFYAPVKARFYSMESQARKLVLPSFISESHFLSRIPICLMIPSRRTLPGPAKSSATSVRFGLKQKRTGIDDFIETLPDGYDTDMGQMNARLSGRERQRIGIARIFLRNPDICQWMEPSSALDALHEKELLHTLQTEYADKTILLISHRSSTLTGCNRILKMQDKTVKEK